MFNMLDYDDDFADGGEARKTNLMEPRKVDEARLQSVMDSADLEIRSLVCVEMRVVVKVLRSGVEAFARADRIGVLELEDFLGKIRRWIGFVRVGVEIVWTAEDMG